MKIFKSLMSSPHTTLATERRTPEKGPVLSPRRRDVVLFAGTLLSCKSSSAEARAKRTNPCPLFLLLSSAHRNLSLLKTQNSVPSVHTLLPSFLLLLLLLRLTCSVISATNHCETNNTVLRTLSKISFGV